MKEEERQKIQKIINGPNRRINCKKGETETENDFPLIFSFEYSVCDKANTVIHM